VIGAISYGDSSVEMTFDITGRNVLAMDLTGGIYNSGLGQLIPIIKGLNNAR